MEPKARSSANSRGNWSNTGTDASALGDKQGAVGLEGVDLEDNRLIAYMVNNNHELVWHNAAARERLFGFSSLYPTTEMRNVFLLFASMQNAIEPHLLKLHIGLAKPLLSRQDFQFAIRLAEEDRLAQALNFYDETQPIEEHQILNLDYSRQASSGGSENWRVMCARFREGILCVHAPLETARDLFVSGLGDRGSIIRKLSSQQMPLLTPMAVLVADLQDSVRICAELPPGDYFALINQIWNTVNPLILQHFGQVGKHAGDGIVSYFFPRIGGNFLKDAALCAIEIKKVMRRISKEWQIEREWTNELYLNMGLHEGQEWVGTFHIGDTIQFTALGDTINHSARLSELARYGQLWASKAFVTRLQSETGLALEYGVHRPLPDGRQQFVKSSFAQVSSLMETGQMRHPKLMDIGTLAVTEISGVVSQN